MINLVYTESVFGDIQVYEYISLNHNIFYHTFLIIYFLEQNKKKTGKHSWHRFSLFKSFRFMVKTLRAL